MKFPYFRVTSWDSSLMYAERWFNWFKSLGHPVALFHMKVNQADGGRNAYSVWRYGNEYVQHNEANPNGESIPEDAMQMMVANGFEL